MNRKIVKFLLFLGVLFFFVFGFKSEVQAQSEGTVSGNGNKITLHAGKGIYFGANASATVKRVTIYDSAGEVISELKGDLAKKTIMANLFGVSSLEFTINDLMIPSKNANCKTEVEFYLNVQRGTKVWWYPLINKQITPLEGTYTFRF